MTDRAVSLPHVERNPRRPRRARLAAAALALATTASIGLLAPAVGPTDRADAAGDPNEIIAFVAEGVGNGHGRGLSQWGSYGWAVTQGRDWRWILDHYYGGTTLGDLPANGRITVRLTPLDGAATTGVVSAGSTARFNDDTRTFRALYARETTANTFEIYGSSTLACPGSTALPALTVPDGPLSTGSSSNDPAQVRQVQNFLNAFGYNAGSADGDYGPLTTSAVQRFQAARNLSRSDGQWRIEEATAARAMIAADAGSVSWQRVATVAGPVTFRTSVNESTATPGDVLGVCQPNGSIIHYRGTVRVLNDSGGVNRTVNDVRVEDYLRGVVPRESPASWADAGSGSGIHALRAQSVAARSYGVRQTRYSYAQTCDTSSCQVYGGAARRSNVNAPVYLLEDYRTDRAIADTAGKVRRWPDGSIVSTEFSASNGPRTAGGAFPAVDDPADDVPGNPLHRWTRIIDADVLEGRYGISTSAAVRSENDPSVSYDGVWDQRVRLTSSRTVSNWDFRNAFGLPSPGFTLRPVTRQLVTTQGFAFIGDSVGLSVTSSSSDDLRALLDGVFAASRFDAVGGRCTSRANCIGTTGVQAASQVPMGTQLVVVELGYNDEDGFAARIDAVMTALRARNVQTVAWVTMSERRTTRSYASANAALRAATGRWPELTLFDWQEASSGRAADRWFSDNVHLTTTGQAEFGRFLRDRIIWLATGQDGAPPTTPTTPPPTTPPVSAMLQAGVPLRVPVLGRGGVPGSGVSGVSLNVTAVLPEAAGHLTVWPCGSPRPTASNLNYGRGGVVANAVVSQVDATGEVCVVSHATSHVIVDVGGWFGSGFTGVNPSRLVDTRGGAAVKLQAGVPLRVPVLGRGGVPGSGVSGVSLNVTAVLPEAAGHLTVWPCGSPRPTASNLNYGRGGVVANAVVSQVDATGEVCVVSHATSHVIVDVGGWFGSGFTGVNPSRLVDTRTR